MSRVLLNGFDGAGLHCQSDIFCGILLVYITYHSMLFSYNDMREDHNNGIRILKAISLLKIIIILFIRIYT